MASIIKIKRSSNPGAPTKLGQGEMAYSYAAGNYSVQGDRLFIGTGSETAGDAALHSPIGGLYYTRLIDASSPGTLTTNANSVPVLNSSGKIDKWYAGNTYIYNNNITTTNTNENLVLDPNGTGMVQIAGTWTLPRSAGTNNYVLMTNGVETASWHEPKAYIGTTSINVFGDSGSVTAFAGLTTLSGTNAYNKLELGSGTYLSDLNSGAVKIQTGVGGSIGHTWSFNANGSTTFNNAYTLPASDGTANYILKTDGSGAVSFAEPKIYIGTTAIDLFNTSGSTASLAVDISGKATTAGTADRVAHTLQSGTDLSFSSGSTYDGNANIIANVTSTLDSVVGRGNTTTSGITVGRLTIDSAYTLPIVDGVGGYILKTYGNGVVYWSSATAAQVQSDYTQTDTGAIDYIKNKPTLATVATSGSYNDLINKPDTAAYLNINSDSNNANVSLINDTLDFVGRGAISTAISRVGTTVSVTTSVANASTSGTIGVATYDSDNFSITNAKVSIKAGGITNASLANANVVIGATTVNLGSTVTAFAGLTSFQVGNIKIYSDNQIINTQTDGNINLRTTGVGVVDVGNTRITSLAAPQGPNDAVNRSYVDAVTNGFHVHNPAVVATHANLATISGGTVTYNNRISGVGATLTLSSAITIIDGLTFGVDFVTDDRILVKNQANEIQNGIYTINAAGTILTRATDFNSTGLVNGGDFIFIIKGNDYGSTGWVQTTDAVVLGTDPVVFSQFAGVGTYKAGIGLYLDGTVFNANVNSTTGGIEIVSNQFQLKSTLAGNGLTYTTGVLNIGGTANRITVSADAIDIASNYVGQSTITTLGNITTGTWSGTTIGTYAGGTGFTSYSAYDLLVGKSDGTLDKLSKGTAGQLLQVNSAGTALVYADLDGGSY